MINNFELRFVLMLLTVVILANTSSIIQNHYDAEINHMIIDELTASQGYHMTVNRDIETFNSNIILVFVFVLISYLIFKIPKGEKHE